MRADILSPRRSPEVRPKAEGEGLGCVCCPNGRLHPDLGKKTTALSLIFLRFCYLGLEHGLSSSYARPLWCDELLLAPRNWYVGTQKRHASVSDDFTKTRKLHSDSWSFSARQHRNSSSVIHQRLTPEGALFFVFISCRNPSTQHKSNPESRSAVALHHFLATFPRHWIILVNHHLVRPAYGLGTKNSEGFWKIYTPMWLWCSFWCQC